MGVTNNASGSNCVQQDTWCWYDCCNKVWNTYVSIKWKSFLEDAVLASKIVETRNGTAENNQKFVVISYSKN